MAKKKKSGGDGGGGAPAWMATFSDLMNLLLCFFVLLFSMSSVDAEKFEMVIASLQSSFSVLPAGGSSIDEGELINAGISQLSSLDMVYNSMMYADEQAESGEDEEEKDLKEQYQEEALAESEAMAEAIKEEAASLGIQDMVEVDFNGQYVSITLNGTLLFDSGSYDIKDDAVELVDKIGTILEMYGQNIIEVEGHTDNVPYSGNGVLQNNDMLSSVRALSVVQYFRDNKNIDPVNLKFAGRGEYDPIADNSTEEGRARNRRVEIQVFNSYSDY